jgi:hypothetical protein
MGRSSVEARQFSEVLCRSGFDCGAGEPWEYRFTGADEVQFWEF